MKHRLLKHHSSFPVEKEIICHYFQCIFWQVGKAFMKEITSCDATCLLPHLQYKIWLLGCVYCTLALVRITQAMWEIMGAQVHLKRISTLPLFFFSLIPLLTYRWVLHSSDIPPTSGSSTVQRRSSPLLAVLDPTSSCFALTSSRGC